MGIIYLLKTREFINTNIFKIGRSGKDGTTRTNQYPKGSILYLLVTVNNDKIIEQMIINSFLINFIHKKDYGNEYFEGDYKKMMEIIFKRINTFNDESLINNLDDIQQNIKNFINKALIKSDNTQIKLTDLFEYYDRSEINELKFLDFKFYIKTIDTIKSNCICNYKWNIEFINEINEQFNEEIKNFINESLIKSEDNNQIKLTDLFKYYGIMCLNQLNFKDFKIYIIKNIDTIKSNCIYNYKFNTEIVNKKSLMVAGNFIVHYKELLNRCPENHNIIVSGRSIFGKVHVGDKWEKNTKRQLINLSFKLSAKNLSEQIDITGMSCDKIEIDEFAKSGLEHVGLSYQQRCHLTNDYFIQLN